MQNTAWGDFNTVSVMASCHKSPTYDYVNRGGALTQVVVRVKHWNENASEGMQLDIAELAVRRLKDESSNKDGTPSTADRCALLGAEIAEVEEAASSGSSSVQEETEEIFKPDVIVEDDDKGWDLEGIITVEEVQANR